MLKVNLYWENKQTVLTFPTEESCYLVSYWVAGYPNHQAGSLSILDLPFGPFFALTLFFNEESRYNNKSLFCWLQLVVGVGNIDASIILIGVVSSYTCPSKHISTHHQWCRKMIHRNDSQHRTDFLSRIPICCLQLLTIASCNCQ